MRIGILILFLIAGLAGRSASFCGGGHWRDAG